MTSKDSRPSKRPRLDRDDVASTESPANISPVDSASIRSKRAAFLNSISRSISPPVSFRSAPAPPSTLSTTATPQKLSHESSQANTLPQLAPGHEPPSNADRRPAPKFKSPRAPYTPAVFRPSPFQLTSIHGLEARDDDAISLHDILGNPLIREAWVFNFCFDVDWLMGHFDVDVRAQVQVRVVHGSWKTEDSNKQGIDAACRRWPNVESLTAYLPHPFGTHHSKMFVLFTHDEQAQVIIHTANMLEQDWTNMTQAVWRSPTLPKLTSTPTGTIGLLGSGSRFKHDLLAYLQAYGSKTKPLRDRLSRFDFSQVRGALVASTPSETRDLPATSGGTTGPNLWGYPKLSLALKEIPIPDGPRERPKNRSPHVVCQISSIASLPKTWLDRFFPVLTGQGAGPRMWEHISIVYPTPSNVASSLDGYASGGSIHTKAQSAAHLKQITTLRKSLCAWTQGPLTGCRAGRHAAAPHIKTYVRFSEKPTCENPTPDIEWALLTSANLSTQAWGTFREKERAVVVQSFEIGVLVWPALFAVDFESGEETQDATTGLSTSGGRDRARMVPVFGRDRPTPSSASGAPGVPDEASVVVGLRIPYDLPLTPYHADDMPWSPQGTYDEPDRFGWRYSSGVLKR